MTDSPSPARARLRRERAVVECQDADGRWHESDAGAARAEPASTPIERNEP